MSKQERSGRVVEGRCPEKNEEEEGKGVDFETEEERASLEMGRGSDGGSR